MKYLVKKFSLSLKILIIFVLLLLIIYKTYPDNSNDDSIIYSQLTQERPILSPTEKISSEHKSLLPRIQFDFPVESIKERKVREYRKESIKQGFLHAWKGYSKYAWGADEVEPITNTSRRHLNGWGATMVDALDTMWIMDLKKEFKDATNYLSGVDFTNSYMNINFFETVIRYLGGLLSAHELSGDEILLRKANDLGGALYPAFNSQSGLPYNIWNISRGIQDRGYRPYNSRGILAEVGSSQLEYMKLAQLTGNSSYFDVAQKVIDTLDKAKKIIPGLYPIYIDLDTGKFSGYEISIGNFGDSFYEYLLKQYILVGGSNDQYKRMYDESAENIIKYLIKEGQVNDHPELLFIGSYGGINSKMDHLSCFVPGMLAIGSKILNRSKDLDVAIRIAETCYWSYKVTATGIGPENFMFIPKDDSSIVNQLNQFPMRKNDNRYLLRPETVESLFVLYRITGDKKYQERGWKIWESIEKWCKTPTAYSGLQDVTSETPRQNNNMESFFLAETMKYLYLLFSTPDVISLDNYVFNTEAHPFLINKKKFVR